MMLCPIMRWLPLFLFVAASTAWAQPAERFHEGARLYVDGDLAAAAQAVDAGLAEAPADARLRALRELIRQQQPPGGGGDTPDESEPSDEGDGETPPGETPGESPPEGDGEGSPDDASPPAPSPGADGSDPSAETSAGTMSRAEAEALLDAVGGDERLLLRQLRRRSGIPARPERDW